MATEQEVGKMMLVLAVSYPNFKPPISADECQVWYRSYHAQFGEYPVEIIQAAFDIAKQHSPQFYPPAAAILKEIHLLLQRPQRSGVEAWGDVIKEIKRVGLSFPPVFEDGVTKTIVEGMGWHYLCLSEESMVDRAHFIKAYEQASKREADKESLLMLPSVKRAQELIGSTANFLSAPDRKKIK